LLISLEFELHLAVILNFAIARKRRKFPTLRMETKRKLKEEAKEPEQGRERIEAETLLSPWSN